MAFPTILVDSATGSDTQASGAGPATALFGTGDASTDVAGTTVTLTAGTDLSGVATDGSHVILLYDSTAGNQKFGKITGKAGSGGATPTVTVATAFGSLLTLKNWAIGGKLASVFGTYQKCLWDNNGGAGDARPGWTAVMADAHAESFDGVVFRRHGDTTDGPIRLIGDPNATTQPVLTNTGTNTAFAFNGSNPFSYFRLENFELIASNGSPGAAFDLRNTNESCYFRRLVVDQQAVTAAFFVGNSGDGGGGVIEDCYFDTTHASSPCGFIKDSSTNTIIRNTYIRARNYIGIATTGATYSIESSVIDRCGSVGIYTDNNAGGVGIPRLTNVLIVGCADSGFYFQNALDRYQRFVNVGFVNNGGYGIYFNSAPSDAVMSGLIEMLNCGFYGNTSGISNVTFPDQSAYNTVTTDPGLIDPTNLNFMIGTAWKALGYPLPSPPLGLLTATHNYVDIGAAQRQESGGGGGLAQLVAGGFIR